MIVGQAGEKVGNEGGGRVGGLGAGPLGLGLGLEKGRESRDWGWDTGVSSSAWLSTSGLDCMELKQRLQMWH